jgi:hypothetical protein
MPLRERGRPQVFQIETFKDAVDVQQLKEVGDVRRRMLTREHSPINNTSSRKTRGDGH